MLRVVYGLSLGGGGVRIVESKSGRFAKFTDVLVANTSVRLRQARIESVSFSSDSRLLAIREGGRISLYRRTDRTAFMVVSGLET